MIARGSPESKPAAICFAVDEGCSAASSAGTGMFLC